MITKTIKLTEKDAEEIIDWASCVVSEGFEINDTVLLKIVTVFPKLKSKYDIIIKEIKSFNENPFHWAKSGDK